MGRRGTRSSQHRKAKQILSHARISLRATRPEQKRQNQAGIVAVPIIAGSVFNQAGQEHQVNQPSTQSLADDNTQRPKRRNSLRCSRLAL